MRPPVTVSHSRARNAGPACIGVITIVLSACQPTAIRGVVGISLHTNGDAMPANRLAGAVDAARDSTTAAHATAAPAASDTLAHDAIASATHAGLGTLAALGGAVAVGAVVAGRELFGTPHLPPPVPPGSSPNPPSKVTLPTAPVGAWSPQHVAAARMLGQAGYGGDLAAIEGLVADLLANRGYAPWLDAQFAAPRAASTRFDWLASKGYTDIAYEFSNGIADYALWLQLLTAPDALRQRVAQALSEILVVSINGALGFRWPGFAFTHYVDLLEQNAFGNFRDLLGAVTLSPAMGGYLNMRGNKKEDPSKGRRPDENYAREIMQLFTIGLYELNADGTPKLDGSGNPIETYTQDDVTQLARVFTGWNLDTANANTDGPEMVRRPMTHSATNFSTGDKYVLGVKIPAAADGPTALATALDVLAAHPNVGPFIGRQLIQRLVCSNPSPAYVGRISAVFADNGSGVRGDLHAVVRAILLDDEARSSNWRAKYSPAWGRLRDPLQRFVQWARTFGFGQNPTGATYLYNLSDPGTALGQSPLRSPSVFNFYRPGYVPPDSEMAAASVTAPEFQITNETSVAGYLNFIYGTVAYGKGGMPAPDYSAYLTLANDAPALVARISLLLAADALSASTKQQLSTAVASIAATSDSKRLNRIRAAIVLVMASPDYLVQK